MAGGRQASLVFRFGGVFLGSRQSITCNQMGDDAADAAALAGGPRALLGTGGGVRALPAEALYDDDLYDDNLHDDNLYEDNLDDDNLHDPRLGRSETPSLC